MKIISLFTKAPQHQRFSYRPRYYDPKKEEMQEREERIRRELELARGNAAEAGDYRTRIAGSFQAARKRSKPSAAKSAVIMRFGVLLFMTLLLMAMFQWGKDALYAGFLIVPFYLYLKFKDFRNS
jgi:hypothetical protein